MAAIGGSDTPAAVVGAADNVNAKLLLMDEQLQELIVATAVITGQIGNAFVPAGSVQETLQSAATSAISGTVIRMDGYKSLTIHVTGTGSGTVTFQGSIDGSNWFNIAMRDTTQTAQATLVTTVTGTATPATGAFVLPQDYALWQFRANITTYTAGAFTVLSRKYPR